MRFADPDSDQKLFLHSFYPLGSQILNIKYSKFEVSSNNSSVAQYTNKTVMRIGGLILNSTKFFPLFESADVLALPNSSH